MKHNLLQEKTFAFAVRIVKLYQSLKQEKQEYILSKQLMRSGTSVGAMVREAIHAESRADFIHKLAIAQKEINESIYWIELMKETGYLTNEQYKSIDDDAIEILKLITAIVKKLKSTPNN